MRFSDRIEKIVWASREQPRGPWAGRAIRLVQTVIVLGRDLARGRLTLRAMGLVYTTLLSIVPLLALSFSVLKAFGVSGQIQPVLLNFLAPLGEMGEELARHIIRFIENINVGVLGTLGLALLVYTVISLMQKIEESLNFVWHIPRPRPFGERFSRYLSALLIGPILVLSVLGITSAVMNTGIVRDLLSIEVLGRPMQMASQMTSFLLVISAFTFCHRFIPNTRVKLGPALVGGIAGGIAWQAAGWIFATFMGSSKSYAAIYSSLAILILFMVWLYVSWMTLLFGASVAFYAQHPEYLYPKGGEPRLSNRMRERLALSVASQITARFLAGERAAPLTELTQSLGVPMHALQVVLDALQRRHLIVQSGDDPSGYLPARDPALITVAQLLDAVRRAGEEHFLSPERLPAPKSVDEVLAQAREAVEESVGEMTLSELVARDEHRAKAQ